ncbi:hypothetical protein [Mucilaginibacter sp. FT3.2]|uniref:hypothetical protein n=1 Tax=Mucilaginibacter sp. FT3.2 TaxID=2723090 RepID=UPI00161139D6|nr:hypothetical protein [Mucilaginibacter sp. FT3.2]MBB6233379.1 hypothetical protein [Mucilaginibacter sp. FT3.2]
MNEEYTLSRRWKVFTYIFVIAVTAGGVYLCVLAKPADSVHHIAVAVVCWLLAAYSLRFSIRKKVIITSTHIINQGTFTRSQLLKSDIEGYKIEKQNLIFEAKPPAKRLYISSCHTLDNYGGLLEFARKFKDIYAKQYQNELDTMLHDEAIGSTPKERKQNVAVAKRLCNYVNYTGIAIAIWVVVYPFPYRCAILTGLIYPLLVIGLFYAKRHILTFNSTISGEGHVYPNLTYGLIAPACALALKAMFSWDLLSYIAVIWPALVIGTVLFSLFAFILNDANIKTRSNEFTRVHIGFFIFVYSCAATIIINCEFDNAAPQVYKTTVTDRRYTTGKGATHYVTIDKCGPLLQPTEVTVGESFYQQASPGKTINVNAQPGLLHIPWFYLSQ